MRRGGNFCVGLALGLWAGAAALAAEAKPIWVGRIVFDYRLSRALFEDNSDAKSTMTHELHEEAGVTVEIKACGRSAQNLRIAYPQVNYLMKESRITRARGPACSGSETQDTSLSGVRNPQLPGFLSQSILSVDPDSRSYRLSISLPQDPVILATGTSSGIKKHPNTKIENIGSPGQKEYSCELITFKSDIVYDLLTTEPSSACDASGRQCSAKVPATERIVPLQASFSGKYDGGKKIKGEVFYPDSQSIYGSALQGGGESVDGLLEVMQELGRHSPDLQRELAEAAAEMRRARAQAGNGGSEAEPGPDPRNRKTETLRASWEFDLVAQCDDIVEDLQQSLSVLRAYADEGILERAAAAGIDGSHEGDGQRYDDMVGREGYLQYKAHWWDPEYEPPAGEPGVAPDPQGSAAPDMYTDDETCAVPNYDEVKADYERKCFPAILIEAVYEHEKVHVGQCRDPATAADYKSGTPESYRKFELEAHCHGIGLVLDYAGKQCPGRRLSPFQKEHQRICGR